MAAFTDRGVPGHEPVSYALAADGTVEYFCGDAFWGVTSWSGTDWSDPLTERQRGRITGAVTMRVPSTTSSRRASLA